MGRKRPTNPIPEINFAVRGAVIPEGSHKAAQATVSIGDGFAPTVLIQLGTDGDGTVVAQVTAGGFADLGSRNKNLIGVGGFLAQVAAILTDETPVD